MNERSMPSPNQFFSEISLYDEHEFGDKDTFDIAEIIYFEGNTDLFCTDCGKETTYIGMQKVPNHYSRRGFAAKAVRTKGSSASELTFDGNIFDVSLMCARNNRHVIHFIFKISTFIKKVDNKPTKCHSIQKIGQIPSFADLQIPHIEAYSSVLSKQDKIEFVKAVGLSAHGIGVGAYVYLRRIFENLIENARTEAISQGLWSDALQTKYATSRVRERIQLVKHLLPDFLVDHPEMYSLLSIGIHELTEEECLKHFNALKVSIEIILDQKLEERSREKRLLAAKKAIRDAHGEVKSTNESD